VTEARLCSLHLTLSVPDLVQEHRHVDVSVSLFNSADYPNYLCRQCLPKITSTKDKPAGKQLPSRHICLW
jgi:hypothetical protein